MCTIFFCLGNTLCSHRLLYTFVLYSTQNHIQSIVIITEYTVLCLAKLHELYITYNFVMLVFSCSAVCSCIAVRLFHRFAVNKVVRNSWPTINENKNNSQLFRLYNYDY